MYAAPIYRVGALAPDLRAKMLRVIIKHKCEIPFILIDIVYIYFVDLWMETHRYWVIDRVRMCAYTLNYTESKS